MEKSGGEMAAGLQVADVSHQAAWIPVERYGPAGFIGAIVQDGVIVSSRRTKGTRARPLRVGDRLEEADLQIAEPPRSLSNQDMHYFWWKIRSEVETPPGPEEGWRNILESILKIVPPDQRELTRARVNAVAGLAIGRLPRGSAVQEIYQRVLEAFQNRQDRDRWLADVAAHRDFAQYLLARAYDRASAP